MVRAMVKTQTFERKTTDGAIPLVITADEGPSLPTLVVVPSIFGVGDDLLAQMNELASGAIVVAMDPFWRVDPGAVGYDDAPRAVARMKALDMAACYRDVVSILGWAKNHPRGNGTVTILGICFGGPFSLLAAADGHVDGVATWHGSRMQHFLERVADMTCPMVHHVGGADAVVPPEAVDALRAAFAEREDVSIVVHPGAAHGFTHRGNQHHDERAEEAAMADVAALLRHLA